MYKCNKARASDRSGSKTIMNGVSDNASSRLNYRPSWLTKQCTKCRSDYMKFAVDGFCQRCLQRVEFILREKQIFRGGTANDV